LSEAKHFGAPLFAVAPDDQRFFSRDCGIRVTGTRIHEQR
jgi:hypothetical protein